LLKNDTALPLATGWKVAVLGPLADDRQHLNGWWSIFGSADHSLTLLQTLRERLGSQQVRHAQGCGLTDALPDGLDQACAAARASDVIVLCIGESARWSGEARSRLDTSLPAAQLELARAIHACGKPVVAVVTTGRPAPLGDLEPLCDAILIGWFLGSQSGPALCNLLTGVVAPRGHLPVSFPRHSAQAPLYYNRMATGRPWRTEGEPFRAAYGDVRPTPLYPFGFGLTYTRFAFGDTLIESDTFTPGRPLEVSCSVTNTGPRSGDALAQLYVRDLAASVVRPIRELKDYRWITLRPGESATVCFTLTADQLRFPDQHGNWVWEPGKFELWIARDAESGVGTIATLLASEQHEAAFPLAANES
jgi:beta-glucosidase